MIISPIDRRALPEGATFSRWKAADGWPLRRMDWPQPEGSAVRGSILFANGRGDFIEKYLEAVSHWHSKGWNVASFDWRGQGDSRGDIVGGHLVSFDPLLDDIDGLLADWLKATPGPHILIGHSMGGHLALRLVAERNPKLDALVLVAPMLGINARPLPPRFSRFVAQSLCLIGLGKRRAFKNKERPATPGISRRRFLTSSAERYEDELWWKERQPGFELGPPSWGWLAAAYRSIARFTPQRLERVSLPVLIIATERDRLVSADAIRRAASLMPNAELFMFSDAAHEILRESDSFRLEALARIDVFLDQQG